jgi:hypothetical protein
MGAMPSSTASPMKIRRCQLASWSGPAVVVCLACTLTGCAARQATAGAQVTPGQGTAASSSAGSVPRESLHRLAGAMDALGDSGEVGTPEIVDALPATGSAPSLVPVRRPTHREGC